MMNRMQPLIWVPFGHPPAISIDMDFLWLRMTSCSGRVMSQKRLKGILAATSYMIYIFNDNPCFTVERGQEGSVRDNDSDDRGPRENPAEGTDLRGLQ